MLNIRKIQIKTTMRYYFAPTRVAIIIKKDTTANVGGDVEK